MPAGTALAGTGRAGQVGHGGRQWTATYGFVAANALGLPIAIDGVNEHGLAFGALNFPASAEYLEVSDQDQSRSIGSFEVGSYLLSTCATVAEVKRTLQDVPAEGVALEVYGGHVPPLHYTVHDTDGGSVVIEYTDGQLHIYDNPTTVMTGAGGTGEGGGVTGAEITQWMTVVDQRNAVMYASTYDHPNLFKVDVPKAAAAADGIVLHPLPSMDDIPGL